MRGNDPDTGEARFDGPPRASQRRENANHTWFFDGERQPVSELSSSADDGCPNPSDPEALVQALRGDLGGRPAESAEQAAGLLAWGLHEAAAAGFDRVRGGPRKWREAAPKIG